MLGFFVTLILSCNKAEIHCFHETKFVISIKLGETPWCEKIGRHITVDYKSFLLRDMEEE